MAISKIKAIIITFVFFSIFTFPTLFSPFAPWLNGWNGNGYSIAQETSGDSAEMARRLQMEGTRLQLQGKLADALEKYRKSLELKPNPKLEELVKRLESRIANKNTAGIKAPRDKNATLVYSYVDWQLKKIDEFIAKGKVTLETNRNYQVVKDGQEYVVELNPFIFHIDKAHSLDFGPVTCRFKPDGEKLLNVSVKVPSKTINEGITLKFASIDMEGIWNAALKDYDRSDITFSDVSIIGENKDIKLSFKNLSLGIAFNQTEGTGWEYRTKAGLAGLILDLGNDGGILYLDDFKSSALAKGKNYKRFQQLRKELMDLAQNAEKIKKLSDLKPLFDDSDEILDLFTASNGTMSLEGLNLKTKDVNIHIENIALHGDVSKDMATRAIDTKGKFTMNGTLLNVFDNTRAKPHSMRMESMVVNTGYSTKSLPKGFFKDLYNKFEKAESIEDPKAQDAYLEKEAINIVKGLLILIGKASSGIEVKQIAIENMLPAPFSLKNAYFNMGFDTTRPTGGAIELAGGYNDLSVTTKSPSPIPIPHAANMKIELSQIPSILDLLDNPEILFADNTSVLEQQLLQKGLAKLQKAALKLAIRDTYVAFPASRIDIALDALQDLSAKLFTTGELRIKIENPEEFKAIMKALIQDPQFDQLYATITAMANRTNKDGKVVDELNLRVTKEGLLFLNDKDITDMFFPSAKGQQQGTEPAPDKNSQNTKPDKKI